MEDDMRSRLEELEKKRARLMQSGGLPAIEKQHNQGKLTARERIDKLLDSDSFVEFDLWAVPRKTGFDVDQRELPGETGVLGFSPTGLIIVPPPLP